MKLTKTLFIAAATLSFSAVSDFCETASAVTATNLTGASDISVASGLGNEYVLTQDIATTYSGRLLSAGVTMYEDLILPGTGIPGTARAADDIGVIRIKGAGELEIQSWRTELNLTDTGAGGFYSGRVFYAGRTNPTRINDPQSPGGAAYSAFSGAIHLENSVVLRVSGYLNQYFYRDIEETRGGFSQLYKSQGLDTETDEFVRGAVYGVQRVVLNGTSQISFQNSPANIVSGAFDDVNTGPYACNLRFNLIQNVESTGNGTSFTTGFDDTYRVVLHMDDNYVPTRDLLTGEIALDPEKEGSFGYLRGKGQFIKTGNGNLRIKNDGTFEGAVILDGGVTYLSSVEGRALQSAETVNLVSSGDPGALSGIIPGARTSPISRKAGPYRSLAVVSPTGMGWKVIDPTIITIARSPELLKHEQEDPVPPFKQFSYADYSSILAISSDQTIKNFQTYFRRNRGPDEFYNVLAASEFGSVGTGGGTALLLSTPDPNNSSATIDRKLTIVQDLGRDGFYTGTLLGSYGSVLEKRGFGKIALVGSMTSSQSFTGTIDIQQGTIIANGQSLGSGWVNIGEEGNLTVVQNNSGTLLAMLRAADMGELLITHNATIDNEDFSNVAVGSDYLLGVLQIYRAQPEFFGKLTVQGGVTLLLTARDNDSLAPNDAFINAASVTLEQGTIGDASGPGRQTVLSFVDSNQRVTNFSGDPKTRLELGRGTVTLRQREEIAYAGSIRGVGNVITLTDGMFTLSGENTYFGATVLKPILEVGVNSTVMSGHPHLVLSSEGGNTIKNTSALILYGNTRVTSVEVDADGNKVLDEETGLPHYLPQHFGMLFGEPEKLDADGKVLLAAPVIDMGDAALTIGVDADYLKNLESELSHSNIDPNNPAVAAIQAAYYFETLTPGDKKAMPATPQVSDFTIGASRYYLETVLAEMTGEKKAKLDPLTGRPIVNEVTGDYEWDPDAPKGRGLSNADALEYAGQIVGSGKITKVGLQRLTFAATSPDYSGELDVLDGYLRMNADSFPNATQMHVGAIHSDRDSSIIRHAVAEINVPTAPVENPAYEALFDLRIFGEGALTKIGSGALYLSNYEYTGPTSVNNGLLSLPVLPNLSDIRLGYVDEYTGAVTQGTIGFDLRAGENISHRKSIYEFDPELGAIGNVRKRGTGRLVLEGVPSDDPAYADALEVAAGKSDLTPAEIAVLEPAYRLTYSGSTILDDGELVFAGKRWVWETDPVTGEKLRPVLLANVPSATGSYVIGKPATLTFDVDAMFNDISAPAPIVGGALTGSGLLRKDGAGVLVLASEQPGFTGPVDVRAGDLSLRVPYVLENSGVLIIQDGARVFLNDNNQIFQNIQGGTGAVLNLGNANLILNTVPDDPVVYSGVLSGLAGSTLTKNGTGTVVLRGDNIGDFFGKVVIPVGVLDTTTRALGDVSSITVDHGATLRLFSDNLSATPDYLGAPVENVGTVEKTGPGVVHLAWDEAPRNATGSKIHVAEGTLQLDSSRNSNNVPVTIVDTGPFFHLNLQQDGYIAGGVRYEGTTYAGEISGGGSVIFDGLGKDRTLVMTKAPAYAGVTRIQNNAILDVAAISVLNGGIVSDKTSRLHFGDTPRLFTINQSVTEDAFEGTFTGYANLEITGPGILRYAGGTATGHAVGDLSSYAGAITVRGGNLEISVANQKPITLANGNNGADGSIYIRVAKSESGSIYSGLLTGIGTVVKTGEGDLRSSGMSFLGDPAFTTKTLAVDSGRIVFDTITSLSRVQQIDIREGGSVLWKPDPLLVGGSLVPAIDTNLVKSAVGTVFEKASEGALLLKDQPEFKGLFLVSKGELRGNFKLGGDLTVSGYDSSLAPGESPGTVEVEGVFTLEKDATLKVEIQGSINDKVIYGTRAVLDGIIEVSLLGGVEPERGTRFSFIEKGNDTAAKVEIGDNLALLVGTFDGYDASNLYFTLTTDLETGAPVILASQKQLARVKGYKPHEGLRNSFLPVLDRFATTYVPPGGLHKPVLEGNSREERAEYARKLATWEDAMAKTTVGAVLNNAPAKDLPQIVNNLSPLGYGSLVSMFSAAANNVVSQLGSRLEQRRYDRGITFQDHEFQIYGIATGSYANLGGTPDGGPNYNYHTAGGIIGADYQFDAKTTVGLVADYTTGKSTFQQGGGDSKMNAARATAYISTIFGVDGWFFADGGLSAGYSGFDVRRNTATGVNKGSPDAWAVGAFFNVGTVFTLHTDLDNRHRLDLSPSVGLEYNHYEISSSHETGSYSRLHVRSFDHDSLRAKIGAGLNWFIRDTAPVSETSWKIGLDIRFTQEMLEVEDSISSEFSFVSSSRFTTKVNTLPKQTVQLTPSFSWNFTAKTSAFASYQFEWGFQGQQYHSLNLGFRHRF